MAMFPSILGVMQHQCWVYTNPLLLPMDNIGDNTLGPCNGNSKDHAKLCHHGRSVRILWWRKKDIYLSKYHKNVYALANYQECCSGFIHSYLCDNKSLIFEARDVKKCQVHTKIIDFSCTPVLFLISWTNTLKIPDSCRIQSYWLKTTHFAKTLGNIQASCPHHLGKQHAEKMGWGDGRNTDREEGNSSEDRTNWFHYEFLAGFFTTEKTWKHVQKAAVHAKLTLLTPKNSEFLPPTQILLFFYFHWQLASLSEKPPHL